MKIDKNRKTWPTISRPIVIRDRYKNRYLNSIDHTVDVILIASALAIGVLNLIY
jgi:hypothetical protein